MSLDLNKSVVHSNGLVDLNATLTACAEAITAYNTLYAADVEKIGVAVNEVFAQFPNTSMNKPALVSLTMNKLGALDPSTFSTISERVVEFIDTQVKAGALNMKKGKGGGVSVAK